jgi:divalent metal cation (Fe/Co/Zn/Cd) transporter
MSTASRAARSREKTLRVAWILSAWAPLASGAAFWTGGTAVLLADFLRRTSEFIGVFVSWVVVRRNLTDPGAGDLACSDDLVSSDSLARADNLAGSDDPAGSCDLGDFASSHDLASPDSPATSDDLASSCDLDNFASSHDPASADSPATSDERAGSDDVVCSGGPSGSHDPVCSDSAAGSDDLVCSDGAASSNDSAGMTNLDSSEGSSASGLRCLSRAGRRREAIASLVTAGAMIISACAVAARAVGQTLSPVRAGNLSLGLFVVSAGALVNLAFWRRFRRLANEQSTPVVEAQSRLYGTKSAADCAVLAVLLMHRLYPHSDWPAYVDSSVSVCISLLLAASGITVMNRSIGFLSGTNTADPSTSPPGSSRPGNSRPSNSAP